MPQKVPRTPLHGARRTTPGQYAPVSALAPGVHAPHTARPLARCTGAQTRPCPAAHARSSPSCTLHGEPRRSLRHIPFPERVSTRLNAAPHDTIATPSSASTNGPCCSRLNDTRRRSPAMPHCPSAFEPAAYTSPRAVIRSVCAAPVAASTMRSVSGGTKSRCASRRTGALRARAGATPHCPLSFRP